MNIASKPEITDPLQQLLFLPCWFLKQRLTVAVHLACVPADR